MSPLRTASRVVHPCLEPSPSAVPLAEARLTGQWKLGVVLQATGLLSLLARAGWQLAVPWQETAVVSGWAGGRLVVPREKVGPGRSPRPAQELLRELLAALFGPGFIVGRGEARKAARALDDVWGQTLAPISADEAVVHGLDAAPFLWDPAFAQARRGLAGEIWWDEGNGEVRIRAWVAGPPNFRRRILSLGGPPGEVLAGTEARRIWDREEDGDPRELAAAGRWHAAVAAWERLPPAAEAERVERAKVLLKLGRFEAALTSLSGPRSPEAGIVRIRCQQQLKHLGAARAGLQGLEGAALSPEQTVELADLAARLLAGSDPGGVEAWVRRALEAGEEAGGRAALAARLVAAEVAWDREDPDAMESHLEAARGALEVPDLAWRWHQVSALRARLAAAGPEMAEHSARALRLSRRFLARHEAAGLWNDLGVGRAQAGDLPGAERAFLHAVRLLNGCDGPRKTTLALPNLAEIRMRRGRLAGVREILERSAARNRIAGNHRGLVHDAEMGVRFELAQGRAGAALSLYRETVAELDRQGQATRRDSLRVLAARALGWLGRPAEAAAELSLTAPETRAELLEPEERPALWAHAGDLDAALREAAATPFEPLWRTLALGQVPALFAWQALERLEPYRAARLIFDFETLAPGAVPAERLRASAAVLRAVGATPLAEVLEARDQGPWRAVADYVEKEIDPEALAVLFANAGYPETSLAWTHRDNTADAAQVIVAGAGGGHVLTAPLGEGWLALRAERDDGVLRALFALAVRDLARHRRLAIDSPAIDSPWPPSAPAGEPEEARRAARSPRPEMDGIVGESPALLAALERAARLAVSDLAILILGESGTGKELFARHIHRASPRARLPFVAVNCAAFSETLLLSDLFGHVKGAFTGADRDRAGVFEAAQGGTVFLDEIGDLPPAAQGMLLRVLQEGEVRRVGESLPRRVNVRVLAATHRGLPGMVKEGTFREDLYYRLRGGLVELPPLRDRGEDVLILADSILSRIRSPHALRLSKEARVRLLSHSWPGNIRELQNVLSVAAALAGDDRIRPEHLDLPEPRAAVSDLYHQQVDAFRRRLVQEALAACGGSRSEAARRLGLSRQALSYLTKQLGLS